MTDALTILQVNTHERHGGAERVAINLFDRFRRKGHRSYLAVGNKVSDHPDVYVVSTGEGHGPWYRAWRKVADKIGGPIRVLDEFRGIESFHYPATYRIPDLPPLPPDIIHAHNLHGGYFDLGALPWLSRQAPLVLTLHDAWLLSGHCAHSMGCDRWILGCGECPDLTIFPAIKRDQTAYNWSRKQAIYFQSRLYIATPCEWLMERVRKSMLWPGVIDARVIPNGVDHSVFSPGNRDRSRNRLGIPERAHVLLFVASGLQANMFKDYPMVRKVASILAERAMPENVVMIALGERAEGESIGNVEIRFAPYEADPDAVADYYRASDIYLHAARADTFPTTIIEALACGAPVIATAVGGIPEQVDSLVESSEWPGNPPDTATGVLVPPGDHESMANAIITLLMNDGLRLQMGENASRDAQRRFNVDEQCNLYLAWYRDILSGRLRNSQVEEEHAAAIPR